MRLVCIQNGKDPYSGMFTFTHFRSRAKKTKKKRISLSAIHQTVQWKFACSQI